MPDDERYSLTELADLAAVTPRTVRYYLAQGLLPAVGQSGPGSKYDAGHLVRLRLIRRLQAEHLPLAEIRRRLEGLGDDEIRDLAGDQEPAPPPDSALDYLRNVLGASPGPRAAAALSPAAVPPVGLSPMAVPPAASSLSRRMASPLFDAGPRPPAMPLPPAASAPSPAPNALAERLDEPYGSTPATPSPARATPPIERSQWERIVLAHDVELHVRRPLARALNKQVDRLVTIARELLEEDRP